MNSQRNDWGDDPRLGMWIERIECSTEQGAVDLSQAFSHGDDEVAIEGKEVIALVGFPYDEGTIRNGGRKGSWEGPSIVRKVSMHSCECTTQPNLIPFPVNDSFWNELAP